MTNMKTYVCFYNPQHEDSSMKGARLEEGASWIFAESPTVFLN